MSAIAGILSFDGRPPEPALIEGLTATMRRRGPDEQIHWFRGPIALGHCMLRTTPESLEEHQPVVSPDGTLTMVWDGRLDNREELQRHLQSAGVTVRNHSDAELALHCYALWGANCPDRLLGDFAFAVWDARQRRLFCARDHMGARPLYYTHNDRFFAFASQEEALSTLPAFSAKANEELVACYLLPDFRDIDRCQSWIEKVTLLPAAQSLSVSDDSKIRTATYWKLEEGPETQYASDEECQQAFLAVFGEAVRCRLRSLGHVSAMMSGGIDSASIAAMTKRLLPAMPGKQFHTYSAISDEPSSCVETQCIQSLTRDLGGNAHYVSVPSFTGMLDTKDLAEAAWTNAHPLDNSILLPEMMCLAASRDGHRVMLYGGNGDLTMDVPDRYVAHFLRAGQWRRALDECRNASRNNTYLRGTSPVKILSQNLWTACAPYAMKSFARRLRHQEPALAESLISKRFADELKLVERMRATGNNAPTSLNGLQRQQIELLQSPHGIASVLTSCDRIAGRYGMEPRDPWGDKRVVEFFLRLPLRFKVRNGWTKYLARSGFGSDLSPQVRWRLGKEHLGWTFVCRLLDESPELIARTMQDGLARISGFVDAETARNQHTELRKSPSDSSRLNVFRLVTLSLWAQNTFQ